MKNNIYDKVLEKVLARVEKASGNIALNFKGVKPFDKEPIPNTELLSSYEGLTSEDMTYLIQTHGEEKVNDFIYEMEILKNKEMEKIRNAI